MFCGFYAILASFKGRFEYAAWGILIANIFDGLDGWVARLTNSTTKFGVELDSLSDLVAFGVAPAVLIYSWGDLHAFGRVGWGAVFIYVICGALRLARYNVQMGTTESKAFTGLPIPGAATVVASLVLFYSDICTMRFHGLKEINFKERKPFWLLVVVGVAFVLIFIYPEIVIFVFAIIYVIWGIIEGTYMFNRKRKLKKAV